MASIQDMRLQADAFADDGDWDQAAALYRRLLSRAGDDYSVHPSALEASIRAYHFEEACDVASLIEDRFTGKVSAEILLATFSARQGHWDASVRRFERVARSPGCAEQVMKNPCYRQSVLNSEGILGGSQRLKMISHADVSGLNLEDVAEENGSASFIFISGMPRSGTTALGHLFNMLSSVVLLTEMHNPYLVYSPMSFAWNMIQNGVRRNPLAAPDKILKKWPGQFIGDKRPLFHYGLPLSSIAMNDARLIVFHMLRPVLEVAASYQKRADNPEDGWDPLRNVDNCVHELNIMHEFLLDWQEVSPKNPSHELIYVDYGRAFQDLDFAMSLFRRLGAPEPNWLRGAVRDFQSRSRAIMSKERHLPDSIIERVAQKIDFDLATRVAGVTGVDLLRGLQ